MIPSSCLQMEEQGHEPLGALMILVNLLFVLCMLAALVFKMYMKRKAKRASKDDTLPFRA